MTAKRKTKAELKDDAKAGEPLETATVQRKRKIGDLSEVRQLQQYFNRVNARATSLRRAVIETGEGDYQREVASITITDKGDVSASRADFDPTPEESAAIKDAFKEIELPRSIPIISLHRLPAEIRDLEKGKDLFVFRNTEKEILMVHHRVEGFDAKGNPTKDYVPWTYFDDGKWRKTEPDGLLPLYGLEMLKAGDPMSDTVFLHEGAKGAAVIDRMMFGDRPEDRKAREAHPWSKYLCQGIHIGWPGGAPNPHRVDWSPLMKAGVKRGFIVADNDREGKSAVPLVAFHLHFPTFSVEFTDAFGPGFDLGDPFPASMFKEIDGHTFYVGPSFMDRLNPATWATSLVFPAPDENGKVGKPTVKLRKHFEAQWQYVVDAKQYVNLDFPTIRYDETDFDKKLSPFSHTDKIHKLVDAAYGGNTIRLAYQPNRKGQKFVDYDGDTAINTFEPTRIPEKQGDPDRFIEFIRYMIPDPVDAHEALRWIATLVGREDIRMKYMLLMLSEVQGLGKSLLAMKMLRPLVGEHNTSIVSAKDIISAYTGWLAEKRLIICNEIYEGHSWKAYNELKSVITEMNIRTNEKYVKGFEIENWGHVVGCSNDLLALKVEGDDRRMFVPGLVEEKWNPAQFREFIAWLDSGGLSIILHWSRNFPAWAKAEYADHPEKELFIPDYVDPNAEAPMTALKREMIRGSYSDARGKVADLCEAIKENSIEVMFTSKQLYAWAVSGTPKDKLFDKEHHVRKVAKTFGFTVTDRIKLGSTMDYVLISPAAVRPEFKGPLTDAAREEVRRKAGRKAPEDVSLM